jgi:hypothetical protein
MPRTFASPEGDTFAFRLDPAIKVALTREAEARRQSLLLNAAAQDPTSDEAQVTRELEADLDSFADEWK